MFHKLVLISSILVFTQIYAVKYFVCTTPKHFNECEQLNRSMDVQCIVLSDEVSCMERIDAGRADLGVVSADGAFLGSSKMNLVALGTFQLKTESTSFDFQTAIITNTKPEGGLAGVKGFNFCHPGMDTTDVNPFLLTEFERELLSNANIDICAQNSTETLAEKHIKAIHDFFGPSCRRGRWVQEDELDTKLKQTYSNLMALCNNSAFQSNSGRAFRQSLDCLINANVPTVALTTVSLIANETQHRNFTAYTICRNGTVVDVNSGQICVWSTMPNRILIANREKQDLANEMKDWFISSLEPTELAAKIDLKEREINLLKTMLFPEPESSYNIIVANAPLVSLYEYVNRFRQNLTIQDSRQCHTEMRWCTVSNDEQRKCEVWSRAGLNYGIQPVLTCIQRSSKRDCIDDIKMKTVDAVTISVDFGYFAKLNGLKAIAFPETVQESLVRTVLLVGPGITRIENLKGKRGCFSRYGNAAWLSFIDTTRNIILASNTCDYAKLLSGDLGDSCMPGAQSLNLDNMCALCRTNTSEPTCITGSTNIYYGNQGALNCLRDAGDFAAIAKTDNLEIPENATVMCKNGSISTLPGLEVDEDCYLSVLTTDEIVTRRDDPKNLDIQLALLEYDRRFAVDPRSPFKLFGNFDGKPNLLFRDSTPGLALPNSQNRAIQNYKILFQHIDECSSAYAIKFNAVLLIILSSLWFTLS